MELSWDNEEKPYPYSETDHRIKVLYIGGGNAYVEFSDADLCVSCNNADGKIYSGKDLFSAACS